MPLLHIYDMELKRLSYIDLYALIEDPAYISKSEIIPDVGMFVRKVINSNDSLLYFMPENNARMMIYNFTTHENKSIPFLPDTGIPILEKNKWLTYHSVFAVNNISKKIAAAPMLIGQLDFFDLNGNHIHSTNFDDFKKFEHDLIKDNLTATDLKQYIVDLKSYNDTLYAVNLDLPYKFIREGLRQEKSILYKFDWDGNPIHQYILDRHISSFAYDRFNKRLYVYCPYDTANPVWFYELK